MIGVVDDRSCHVGSDGDGQLVYSRHAQAAVDRAAPESHHSVAAIIELPVCFP